MIPFIKAAFADYYARSEDPYYEAPSLFDGQSATDIEVPERPSPQHVFDGWQWNLPLATAKLQQIEILGAAFFAAMYGSVAYMSTTFQADAESVRRLNAALTVFNTTGAVPPGFYWLDAANNQVPMTLAQLQGLAQTAVANGWAAFQKFQSLKAQVLAATTVSAVQAVTW